MRQTHAYRKPGRLLRGLRRTGLFNHKNMFWSWYEPHNFGDWIGPYLFEKKTGQSPLFCHPVCHPNVQYFTAAGSIMRHIKTPDSARVWGSGIISMQDDFQRPVDIHAVRGPLTRKRCLELGYDCPEVYGDPAILMPEFYTPPAAQKAGRIGLIPHFTHLEEVRSWSWDYPGIVLIDVTRPIEDVIAAITSCEATVSSSLHGLILSHAYGLPSAWITLSEPLMGDNVKFADYYASGGIERPPAPVHIDGPMEKNEIKALALSMPMPDLSPLRAPLLAACPFGQKAA